MRQPVPQVRHPGREALEEMRIESSKKMAATNKTFWGQCQEEIEWARMRKTSGCKKRHERIKTTKLMHSKRGTLDY